MGPQCGRGRQSTRGDTHSLYAWKKKYGPNCARHQAKSSDEAEIKRLKEELKRVTEERDLLKKAAVYFANRPE
jgi:transposase